MTDVSVSSAPAGAPRADGARREVRRRRTLPSGRAVVGGFLVAAAVVGVVAVSTADSGTPTDAYAVVRVDVDAGAVLRPGDLELVPLDLPDAQRAVSYTDLAVLDGATALAPLTAGQLVQSSDVAKPPGGPGLATVSLPVEPARALEGQLRRGDRVDVIATATATATEGGGPRTRTVTGGALVVDVVERGGGGLGSPTELSVELAVPPADLEAVAEAGAVATVTLARTTGVAAGHTSGAPSP